MPIDTQWNISPVLGTGDNDSLRGTGRSEVLAGYGGDDRIEALSGNDEVFGGSGNDLIYGQGGNDVIYGNGKPAYVDMSQLVIQQATEAKVTFVDEGAGFRNALGVYEIAADGSIGNVQILFPNASKAGSGGDLVPNQSQTTFGVADGVQLGFFVVSNGYGKGALNREALSSETGRFEFRTQDGQPGSIHDPTVELWWVGDNPGEQVHIRSQYGYGVFHSQASADNGYAPNPDQYSHVVSRASTVTGELLIGFEDLYGGGDNDYDDTIIRVEIGQQNTVALLPVSTGPGNLPDDDVLYGGDGDDEIHGVSGDDIIQGGNGNDKLAGNSGDDQLSGNDGNDNITGNSGNDIVSGGAGNDTISGGSGDDRLNGDGGVDIISGGSGADIVAGGSGDDDLSGNSGDDVITGGSGNDTLSGNSGNDRLDGESGSDTLNGHSGDDMLYGGSGQDRVVGGSGNDVVDGGEHNDRVYGGSGDDMVYGGLGNDYLSAGSGNDIVSGGAGNDRMFGGLGADSFIWASEDILNEQGVASFDRIADFSDEDVLDFSLLALDTSMGLDQLVSFSETDRGTSVAVNLSGSEGDFTDVVLLQDVFGVSAQAYLDSDTLFI